MKAFYHKNLIEAGCDEAGRGCLAGPVFAAAVILPINCQLPGLNDSKKLTASQRNVLRVLIEKTAIAWHVASSSEEEIFKFNILRASILAMHRAVAGLNIKPEFLLIDGNRFVPYEDIPHSCEIKGDGRYASIAAASVLCKSHRDAYMLKMHNEHPQYGWDLNKGYPTPKHRAAIAEYGTTPLHRKGFKLLPDPVPQLFRVDK